MSTSMRGLRWLMGAQWANDHPVNDDLLPTQRRKTVFDYFLDELAKDQARMGYTSVRPIRLLEERLAEDPEYLTRVVNDPDRNYWFR